MKPFVILLSIFLCSCSGMSARRTWLGNWKEIAEITQNTECGTFTLTQHQVYWADELDNCEMDLVFTNTTNKIVSFNFQINFSLASTYPNRSKYRDNKVMDGYWTYTNAIVNLRPNESISVRGISKRVVDIRNGSVYFHLSNVNKERVNDLRIQR